MILNKMQQNESKDLEKRTFLSAPSQDDLRPTELEQYYARAIIEDLKRGPAPIMRDYFRQ